MDKIIYQQDRPLSFQPVDTPYYKKLTGYNRTGKKDLERMFREESSRFDIAIFTDHNTTQLVGLFPHDGHEAFFGFWETKDQEVNRKAFEALEKHALERGNTKLTGPVNFNTFHRYRLKLSKSSWNYFLHEPVNPYHYPQWLQNLGYKKYMQYESRKINEEAVQMVYSMKAGFIQTLKDLPYTILTITQELWQQRMEEIHHLVDVIFKENPYYQPISVKQFKQMFSKEFVSMLCPYCSSLFEDPKTGELVAMSFSYPDYSPLGTQDNYTFRRDFGKLKDPCLLIKSIGVHPEHRNKGLMSYLAAHGMQNFLEHYRTAMFCLMRSNNISLRFTDRLPYEKAEYALFSKEI